MRPMPRSRTTSSSVCVPRMSVRRNASGSAIERSTCVSAAKFTIASTPPAPSIAASTAVAVADVAAHEACSAGSSATGSRLSRLPAYVSLSKHDDLPVGVLVEHAAHERAADEAGAAADEQPHPFFTLQS